MSVATKLIVSALGAGAILGFLTSGMLWYNGQIKAAEARGRAACAAAVETERAETDAALDAADTAIAAVDAAQADIIAPVVRNVIVTDARVIAERDALRAEVKTLKMEIDREDPPSLCDGVPLDADSLRIAARIDDGLAPFRGDAGAR